MTAVADEDDALPSAARESGTGTLVGDPTGFAVQLRWLLAQAPVFVLCTDTDLRYVWSAGAAQDELGLGGSGLGRTAYEILGTDDPRHPGIAPLLSALRGEEVSYRIRFGGRWLDNWVGPLVGADGRITGTLAVVLDVTELELTRQRETLAEERFRRLVDHSPALIAVRDAEQRVVHVNPAFLRALDQHPERVEGRTLEELVPDGLAVAERRVVASGEPRVWQGRLAHPRGQAVDVLGHIFPLPLADGTTGVGEVFVDVTDQERSRHALSESEQRYRAIFDGADVGIVLLDLAGRIVDANPACLRLTGRSLRDLRGRAVGGLLTRADLELHEPYWRDLVAGRRGRYDLPLALPTSAGRRRPTRLTVTVVRDRAGRPAGGVAIAIPLVPVDDALPTPLRARPTPAEAAVLERLAAGMTLQQIADELGLSRRGVDYRITRLRHKLRADGPDGTPATSAAVVARAYAVGVLHPSAWPPRVVGDDTVESGAGRPS
ncbi:MAG TPA: PAS domain-containing protein [Pseudonocardia sp.]|nr:PAS domain-containing protein [Pseudonocardia sp.]